MKHRLNLQRFNHRFAQLVVLCCLATFSLQALGQTTGSSFNGNQQEFIRSSSPLANGTTVTRTYVPGGQATTSVAVGSTATPINQRGVSGQQGQARSVLVPTNSFDQQYQYLEARRLQAHRVAHSERQSVLAAPPQTLPQNNGSAPSSAIQNPVVVNQVPATQLPANQVPTLGTPSPVYTTPPPAGINWQGCSTPVAGQAHHSVLQPSATGAFSPVVDYRNLPPGTYVGRGLIGQPKAYVDGQPVRNLLRFITF